jgi:hypothetical protein
VSLDIDDEYKTKTKELTCGGKGVEDARENSTV